MNTNVNYEIKQKLFDKGWRYELNNDSLNNSLAEQRWNEGDLTYVDITISEVVMWLYNKHGIWISVIDVEPTHTLWEYQISKKEIGLIHSSGQYPAKHESSPTEAYEAAIQYCLRMMISDYPI